MTYFRADHFSGGHQYKGTTCSLIELHITIDSDKYGVKSKIIDDGIYDDNSGGSINPADLQTILSQALPLS